jgi:Gpi18-like mannosyltransferase
VTKTLQIVGSAFGVKPSSGVVAFSKEYYMTCRLSSNDSFNFDTQLLVSFKSKGYSYVYVLSRNLNLRPWIRSKLWNVVWIDIWQKNILECIIIFFGSLYARSFCRLPLC